MKTVVVYNSQTGFARRYAWWIAEGAQADCLPLSEAKKKDLSGYEAIVFGGWVCAGQISRIGWFKKNMPAWKGKKLIVYCNGGSPGCPGLSGSVYPGTGSRACTGVLLPRRIQL